MKLLVGRFLLGFISAVLVSAEVSPDAVSELPIPISNELLQEATNSETNAVPQNSNKPLTDSTPVINQRISLSEQLPTSNKNTKIFSKPASNNEKKIDGIVVIHDQSGRVEHHDNEYHDHGYDHDHHHQHVDYHHPPPPRPPPHHHHDDHHHPPSPHHHYYPQPYPGYYPPHYPMPYAHGMSQHYPTPGAVPPQYPYYPPPTYYNSPPMKPTTVIQTSTTSSGITGQNFPKPTDLINQGTEYLWNLFGKLGAVTGGNPENSVHEVVLINTKPGPSATMQMLPPLWYTNKGKNVVQNIDCNNKKE